MKTKIVLSCLLAFSLATTSCSDFLTENPKGKLIPSTYFSSQDELNMSVYSLYQRVMNTQLTTNPMLPQWMGDDMTANPGSNKQAAAEFDRFAAADNNKGVNECWAIHYSLIKAANYIILNAEKTPTTTDEINIAVGQAKFWRAYGYFMLVRVFGPLPINLNNEIDYAAPLASIEDVYKQIIQDLTDIESILPNDYTNAPRKMSGANVYITQQTVKATLAAVYMATAGYPLKQTANYALAAEKAKEVIDGVKNGKYEYILEEEFKHVYAMSHNYSHETVLGINYQQAFTWVQDSQLSSSNLFESVGGWGDAFGEIRFWKNMPEGPRKDAIYAPKILLDNKKAGGKLVYWWETFEKDGKKVNYVPEYHPMFSVFSVGPGDTDYDYTKIASLDMTSSQRHRCIRYAEVLLWYAESQARADGAPNELAYDCINRIRNRAGLRALPAGMNGTDFANAAMVEHGWEVAGNWVALVTRRADQLRMELLKQTFEERVANEEIEVAPGIKAVETVLFANKAWNDKLNYVPYPATDASQNPNLTK